MRRIFRWQWLTLFLLCLCTMLLWQFRFVRSGPNLVPDDVCQNLSTWTGLPNDPTILSADQNGLTLTKRNPGRTVSVVQSLPRIDGVRFLSVSLDAAWENAKPAYPVNWSMPRVVVFGRDAQGHFTGPLDHGILGARGTRDWHRVHAVIDLPPDMQQIQLSADAYGQEGVLRLNHLRIEAVRQRAWFIPATILLLAAWTCWCTLRLVKWVKGSRPMFRALGISLGLLLGFWHFVFPQDRTLFKPFYAVFFMGDIIPRSQLQVVPATPPPVAPVVAPVTPIPTVPLAGPQTQDQVRQPRIRTITPAPTNPTQVKPPPPMQVVPPPVPPTVVVKAPESRQSMRLVLWLRSLDRKWYFGNYNFTHFTAFFGIGLYVFLIAGTGRIWPLPVAIAILGEAVPNALFDIWDTGDWWDLSANLLGLLTAYLLLKWLRARWSALKRRRSAIADPSHPPVASGDA